MLKQYQLHVINGETDKIKELLNSPNWDPTEDGNYAINFAAQLGHKDMVELLLKDDRINLKETMAISYAAISGEVEILKILLQDKNADISHEDYFAVRSVVDNLEVTELLMNHKSFVLNDLKTSRDKKNVNTIIKINREIKIKKLKALEV